MRKVITRLFIILVVIGLLFLGGAFLYFQISVSQGLGSSTPQPCAKNPKPGDFDAAPYYTGPLFETHSHIPAVLSPPKFFQEKLKSELGQEYASLGGSVTIESIVCLMDKENITRAVAFFPVVDFPFIQKSFIKIARRTADLYGDRIIPFITPISFSGSIMESEELERILDKDKGAFKGYGELTFYWDEYKDFSPDSPVFLKNYDVVKKRGLMVMIHPDQGQVAALETAFKENPNVTFILHGMNSNDPFNHLLGTYPNVYYTLDGAGLEPFFTAQSKEEFMSVMKKDFHAVLERAVLTWKPMIEANPTKVMWGTDRFNPWSYDEEVGRVLEEYYRAFIGRLDPAVQEMYAYKNAERLFANP